MKLDSFLKDIFSDLDNREKEILLRRYGLLDDEETLAEIGQDYNLSRERIRQIQFQALKKIENFLQKHSSWNRFLEETKEFLKPLGIKKEIKFHQEIKENFKLSDNDLRIYRFLCLFSKKIYYSPTDENFYSFYAANEKLYNLARHCLKRIYFSLAEHEGFYPEAKFMSLVIKEFKYHFHHQPNFEELIDFLTILKKLAKNPFGFWGFVDHRFIAPRSLRDKIYFILKLENKPLHYLEIYRKLNQLQKIEDELIPISWRKNYRPNLIKNELIRNDFFSFLGKGVYGLQEWGLTPGSAKDLILEFLKKKKIIHQEELWHLISSLRPIKKNSFLIYLKEMSLKNKIKIKDYLIYYND